MTYGSGSRGFLSVGLGHLICTFVVTGLVVFVACVCVWYNFAGGGWRGAVTVDGGDLPLPIRALTRCRLLPRGTRSDSFTGDGPRRAGQGDCLHKAVPRWPGLRRRSCSAASRAAGRPDRGRRAHRATGEPQGSPAIICAASTGLEGGGSAAVAEPACTLPANASRVGAE